MELKIGKVVRYNSHRGFGFLSVIDKHNRVVEQQDVFFHFGKAKLLEINDRGELVFGDQLTTDNGVELQRAFGVPRRDEPVDVHKMPHLAFLVGPSDHREGNVQAIPWTSAFLYFKLQKQLRQSAAA